MFNALKETKFDKANFASLKAWFDNVIPKIKTFLMRHKYGLAFILGLMLILFIFLLSSAKSATKSTVPMVPQVDKTRILLLKRLTEMNEHLSLLSEKENRGSYPSPSEMQTISDQLKQLEGQVNGLQQANLAPQIINAVHESNHQVSKALASLQTDMQSLQSKMQPKHFLAASALPFTVLGIDVWNGVPKATVKINTETALMAESDVRSGWTLTQINFSKRQALFENNQHEFVNIRLAA